MKRPIALIVLAALLGTLIYLQRDMLSSLFLPDRDPHGAEVALRKGQSLFLAGQLDEAAEKYREASRLDPENPLPWAYLAAYYSRKEQTAKALDAWKKAIERAPHVVGYRRNLATTYAEMDSVAQAVATLQEALEMDPANENLKNLLQLLSRNDAAEWIPLEPVSSGKAD